MAAVETAGTPLGIRFYLFLSLHGRKDLSMTAIEVLFRYGAQPSESVMSAYGQLSDVYGIRRLRLEESDHTIRVEYDATRLNEAKVERLLRAAGFDVTEKLALV
jgi:hypothetical protein